MTRAQRNSQREAQKAMKARHKNLTLVAFVVIVLCGVISFKKIELNQKIAAYEKRIAQLEAEKAEEEQRTEEIEEYKAYVQTKKFIEQEARDKLGLVYPDEIVFEPEE